MLKEHQSSVPYEDLFFAEVFKEFLIQRSLQFNTTLI